MTTLHGRSQIVVLVILMIGCGIVTAPAEEKATRDLPTVRAEDAPVEYIRRECLPVLNGIVDSLCGAKDKFPVLAHMSTNHIKKPFDQFLYGGGTPAPGQKDGPIPADGCSIVFFLEPFSRSTMGTNGLSTTTASQANAFPHREYDGLSTRFNYEFKLGTPNDDLQRFLDTVLECALVELAKKEEAFRTRKSGTSQPKRLEWKYQDGAANRSQPIHLGTNSTSSAAGSRR
jgi:hypothetical protein